MTKVAEKSKTLHQLKRVSLIFWQLHIYMLTHVKLSFTSFKIISNSAIIVVFSGCFIITEDLKRKFSVCRAAFFPEVLGKDLQQTIIICQAV
jgi:hypothetical protein